jgi:mono/diheme cytochrome c family protein
MASVRTIGSCGAWLLLASASLVATRAWADGDTQKYPAGRAVYDRWCAACHDPGITHPGTHALMAKYPSGRRASGVIADWTDLPADYVSYMVRHGMSVMPQFRKTEITDGELAALAAYLSRNTPAK